MVKTTITKIEKVKFVPFFKALKSGDFEEYGIDEDVFYELVKMYKDSIGVKQSFSEIELNNILVEITILRSTAVILTVKKYDKDLVELLKSYNIELYPDNVEDVINILLDKIKVLNSRYKTIKSTIPELKGDDKITAYDILADISSSLKMQLNFEKVKVVEVIGYMKVVRKQVEELKKIGK